MTETKQDLIKEYDETVKGMAKTHSVIGGIGGAIIAGALAYGGNRLGLGANTAFLTVGLSAITIPLVAYVGDKIGQYRANTILEEDKKLTPEQLEQKKLVAMEAAKNLSNSYFGSHSEAQKATENMLTDTPKRNVFSALG